MIIVSNRTASNWTINPTWFREGKRTPATISTEPVNILIRPDLGRILISAIPKIIPNTPNARTK